MKIKAIYIGDLEYNSVPVYEYDEDTEQFMYFANTSGNGVSAKDILLDKYCKLFIVKEDSVVKYSKRDFNNDYGKFIESHEIDSE